MTTQYVSSTALGIPTNPIFIHTMHCCPNLSQIALQQGWKLVSQNQNANNLANLHSQLSHMLKTQAHMCV